MLTQTAMTIGILAKNNTTKYNCAYSLDAIKGMHNQISSLGSQILATVQVEKPASLAAMKNLLNLSNTQKVTKWSHIKALARIWEIFWVIPSQVDGSFVGHVTRAMTSTMILTPTLVLS
jgi:hypothetical protein